jgi:nucleotide-binding universal stress UspA family protein
VIVVRPTADALGPVWVGLDGSPASMAALRYGVREALALNAILVVANVYGEQLRNFRLPAPGKAADALCEAEQLIANALEVALDNHLNLKVDHRPLHAPDPARTLVQESAGASLTAVGCRGRGGFAGLRLGTVSQTLLDHATGPIAIIHPATG